MCVNSNNQMANTFKWAPWKWTHSVFLCVLVIFSKSSAGVEFQYPPERNALVAKDGNTLLNSEFLPFLKDCATVNPSNGMLCATYYDMVYNVYQYGGQVADVKAEIQQANQTLEKLSDQFCTLFPTEVIQALDKRPFLEANRLNLTALFRITNYCAINCLTVNDSTQRYEIKQICKSISGGCKWIIKQKTTGGSMDAGDSQPAEPKINENESVKLDEKPSANDTNSVHALNVNQNSNDQNAINIDNQEMITDVKGDGTTNELKKMNVNANTNTNAIVNKKVEPIEPLKLNLNISSNPNPNPNPNPMPDLNQNQNQNTNPSDSKAINMSKPIQPAQKDDKKGIDLTAAKSTENRPSTVSGNKSNQIKDTFTEPRDENTNDMNNDQNDINNNDQDVEDPDKQEDDTEPEDLAEDAHDEERNHEQEVRNDLKNSNNMQSPLLADAADFREDKESSFFPYFMFLMFVIVTMYVAYHNKSKILALLIEGRRSRSYSRGGRRKQHSAEYRKLDSNLEEAIQSDGSHMTSSQIIY